MRIFVASLIHETNTFSPIPTSRASIDGLYHPRGTYAPPSDLTLLGYGTFIELAQANGHQVFPSLFAVMQPSAPLNARDYADLKQLILADLREVLPLNIVFLFLHGAQVAEGCDDCEGDLIAAIRAVVGPETTIGVELDLHANVTPQMVAEADLVMGCLEYPHTDYPERTQQAFELLIGTASGRIKPNSSAWRVPAVGIFPTTLEPMQSLVARLRTLERRPGVLALSAFHGFFLADTSHTSATVVAISDNDPALAEEVGRLLAEDLLATAQQVDIGKPLQAAIDEALTPGAFPVVLADRSDNAGGGAAGDSTFVLRELLRRRVTNAALGMIWDPIAVDFAHHAGRGAKLKLRLGGKCGPMSGDPLDVEALVLDIQTDAKQAVYGQGPPAAALGRSAALRIDGVDVIVNSIRQQVFSRHCFTAHGVDPTRCGLVVVKSTQHFVEDFATFAGSIIYCDAPGTVTQDLSTLPFRNIRRPLYPLDQRGLRVAPL